MHIDLKRLGWLHCSLYDLDVLTW